MAKLTLEGITHAGSVELVDGLISIGRNPTNDFRVSDPTVSSFHCEIKYRRIRRNRMIFIIKNDWIFIDFKYSIS